MQVTETSSEGLKRQYRIVVPADTVEEEISRRLGELGRAVRIPGFRPGKAPMQLLRRRYGPAVRGEVLESTVQNSSAEAMREHNLRPALPPRVEILSAAEGGDLEYSMSVELLPEMPEPDFGALGLERLATEVPDETVETAIARIAEAHRKTETVERPAEAGDILVADLVGRIGDTEIPGSRGEGRQVELGDAGLLPGFTDQLTGAAAGEERTVTVHFPEEYGNPDLAGKEAVFEVAVKEVRHRLPPVIDDELAKALALDSLGELRAEIRQRMQRDYDAMARQRLKQALLDRLAERYQFPVPPGMVEIEFASIWEQYQKEKAEGEAAASAGEAEAPPADAPAEAGPAEAPAATEGSPAEAPAESVAAPAAGEEANPEEEKAKAEYRRIAERRVRLGLLLAEVGRSNNITVTQDEVNQAIVREAQRHPGYERQVVEFYRKNPESVNNLRAPIFEEKVVDFIIELAKPEERRVTPGELLAAAEPESGGGVSGSGSGGVSGGDLGEVVE